MTLQFDPRFSATLTHPDTLKIIATTDENGVPYQEENASIHLDDEGRLVLLETHEYSRTNRNLVGSIWFGRKLAIHVSHGNDDQFQVIGSPYKVLITGPRFEAHYRALRERDADANLAAVWLIDAEAVSDEAPDARREREAAGRLELIHLDRIAKAT